MNNHPVKLKLTVLNALMVLLLGIVFWMWFSSWMEVARLRDRFDSDALSRYRDSRAFSTSFPVLNNIILYGLKRKAMEPEKITEKIEQLKLLLEKQQTIVTTSREKDLLKKLNDHFNAYILTLQERFGREYNELPTVTSDFLLTLEKQEQDILDISFELASEQHFFLSNLLQESQKSLGLVRMSMFISRALLLFLILWIAVEVYRKMIVPLRSKLQESTAIIERQEKLASLGLLAAGVAHEIRNPLTAIKARLFTQQKLLSAGSAEYADSIVIGNEINRLEKIVKDFLHFAKPTEPSLKTVGAKNLIDEVLELILPQLRKTPIEIKTNVQENLRLKADPEQLKQVLINLIQNAAESMRGKGTITIVAKTGNGLLDDADQGAVLVEVRDTGPGIPPEVEKRLFDPFFSTKEGGTGLGLAIAARITEKHGGILKYETQLNKGTTFCIVLPIPDISV